MVDIATPSLQTNWAPGLLSPGSETLRPTLYSSTAAEAESTSRSIWLRTKYKTKDVPREWEKTSSQVLCPWPRVRHIHRLMDTMKDWVVHSPLKTRGSCSEFVQELRQRKQEWWGLASCHFPLLPPPSERVQKGMRKHCTGMGESLVRASRGCYKVGSEGIYWKPQNSSLIQFLTAAWKPPLTPQHLEMYFFDLRHWPLLKYKYHLWWS